jgi:hypothetical protein
MHSQNSARSRLILRGFILGLLALFAAAPFLRAADSKAMTEERVSTVSSELARSNCSSSSPAVAPNIETALLEEFGATLEDSDEIFRTAVQPRKIFGNDKPTRGPDLTQQASANPRAVVSPPLLV